MPRSSKNKVCLNCGDPAIALCTWPVRRFIDVTVGELDIGDVLQMEQGEGIIRSVEKHPNDYIVTIGILYRVPLKLPVPLSFKKLDVSTIPTLRDAKCDAPCCDRCARDPADGKNRVCREHWDAWEKVA